MQREISVEILVIGNEVLQGDVLDTNSHWLCQKLTGLGASVRRVCQVRDELKTIAACVRGFLERGADMLVTTGGLGPTTDDLTLEGIALALGRPLALHPGALEQVQATYTALAQEGIVASAELTPERRKMAQLPQGAEPLANTVGAAPGVLLRHEGRVIICLPGVPEELQDIFQGSLRPHLVALLGQGFFLEWRASVACGDESVLAPLLAPVVAAHPEVYVKSRAKRFNRENRFLITLSARGREPAQVEPLLAAAWEDLAARLQGAGIEVVSLITG